MRAGATARLTWLPSRQFGLASLVVLTVGAALIGGITGRAVREGVIQRTAAVTALYVDSFISPHLQEMAAGTLSPEHFAHFDRLLADTALGARIVAFKVWDLEGRIAYATDRRLVGRTFEPGPGLRAAMAGGVTSALTNLEEPENIKERERWSRLWETYAPVREHETNRVIAVSEFYQLPEDLDEEIRRATRQSWAVVVLATVAMYGLLNGMVGRASRLIAGQHRTLVELHERLRELALGKAQTDEEVLARIARDLHDGPAQDISLGLLRIDALAAAGTPADDVELLRKALRSALAEVRQTAAGLLLPGLDDLELEGVVREAVARHEAKTGIAVRLRLGTLPMRGSVLVKMTVYRVLQEAMNNASRHSGAAELGVAARATADGRLILEVRDAGRGFDPAALGVSGPTAGPARNGGRLGLRGMRARVELLGGTMEIFTTPGRGTTVRATIPLEGG